VSADVEDGPADGDEAASLEIELEPAVARGVYANAVLLNRRPTEITVDFAYLQPDGRALIQARVVLAPATARDLVAVLSAELAEHEVELEAARPPRR
jgi:hypothetical protein